MEARMYLYRREAFAAAQEYVNEDKHARLIRSRPGTIDDRTRGIIEDDRFVAEVGSWCGATPAVEITDMTGRCIGLFGYWREDWEAEELERLDNE